MMLVFAVYNITATAVFVVFSRYAAASICAIGAIRMIVYMIYALKKIKPNIVWLIIFESAFVASTILTWQDALDLMPMFAILISGFGAWQNNDWVLRLSFAINGMIYIIYDAITGIYISLAVEIVNLICTIISFVYYYILKRKTPIMNVIFKNREKQIIQNKEVEDSDKDVLQDNI